jgi:hypothetical protein
MRGGVMRILVLEMLVDESHQQVTFANVLQPPRLFSSKEVLLVEWEIHSVMVHQHFLVNRLLLAHHQTF